MVKMLNEVFIKIFFLLLLVVLVNSEPPSYHFARFVWVIKLQTFFLDISLFQISVGFR